MTPAPAAAALADAASLGARLGRPCRRHRRASVAGERRRRPRPRRRHQLWKSGHPLGAEFPDARGLAAAVRTDEDAVLLWFAYLVRILHEELPADARAILAPLLNPPAGAPDRVLQAFRESGNEPLLALDLLDRRLQDQGRWVFIGYDELDTLGNFDWEACGRATTPLRPSATARWKCVGPLGAWRSARRPIRVSSRRGMCPRPPRAAGPGFPLRCPHLVRSRGSTSRARPARAPAASPSARGGTCLAGQSEGRSTGPRA